MRRYKLAIRGRQFLVDVDEIDANRFRVVVGDESYDVELGGDEDLPEAAITPAIAPTATASAIASALREALEPPKPLAVPPASRKSASGGPGTLAAPMPGVILEVNVKPGDTVARGQQIAVLEAMKMQNSIKSPRAGTIAQVCVAAGQAIGHGDCIVRYRDD